MTSRVSPASLVRPWDSVGRRRTLSQLLSWPLCSPKPKPTQENTKRNASLHLVWEMLRVLGEDLQLELYLSLVEADRAATPWTEHHMCGHGAPQKLCPEQSCCFQPKPASECFRVLLSLPEPSVRAWMRVKWAPSLEKASPRSGNKSLSCSDTNAQKMHYLWI